MQKLKNPILSLALMVMGAGVANAQSIYHDGWIDFNKNGIKDVYEDPKVEIEDRVDDLLSQMTLEEKTNQCATLYGYGRVLEDELPTVNWDTLLWKDGLANIDEHLNGLVPTEHSFPYSQHAKAINEVQRWFIEETRLGIPVDFTNEGLHGLTHDKATSLPAPIATGSTWNRELVKSAGYVVGTEATALGYTNIYAPILDLARDPRWGRTVECYSEDPFLVASLGLAMAGGIDSAEVGFTLKHFAAYSTPSGGRDGSSRVDPQITPRELFQLHLYPYEYIISRLQPASVMSSYNDWDGDPVTGSNYFLTEILRKRFGFKGYVVSDSEAVEQVHFKHKVVSDYKSAVERVALAGLNVRTHFTPPDDYVMPLRELVREGRVPVEVLDKRVADVLTVKFRLGLFDSPYVENTDLSDRLFNESMGDSVSLELARQSMVLLKNQNELLPIDQNKYPKILVTGPLAKDESAFQSRYGPQNIDVISVYEGISNHLNNRGVMYAQGCLVQDPKWPESELFNPEVNEDEQALMDQAIKEAQNSDLIIAVMGEDYEQVGESKSRTSLTLPGNQHKLVKALVATGKPVVLVLINGRPLTINWENEKVPAILEAWFPDRFGGQAIAETIFGQNNPGGKLPITFPKSIGQLPYNFPFKPSAQAGQPRKGPNGYGHTRVSGSLYPFGYGLSYTSFEYADLKLSSSEVGSSDTLHISFSVKNTGDRIGDEVVQLYLRDEVSSVTTYDKMLKAYERVRLESGESIKVEMYLTKEDWCFIGRGLDWVQEPGSFRLMIGSSSTDVRLETAFNLLED